MKLTAISTAKKSIGPDSSLSISAELCVSQDDYVIEIDNNPIIFEISIDLLESDESIPVADIPCTAFPSTKKNSPDYLVGVMDSESAEDGEIGYQIFIQKNHVPGTILCLGNASEALSEARAKIFDMDFSMATILDGIACAFNESLPDEYKVAYIAVLADAENSQADEFWLDEFKKMKRKGRILHCNESLVGCEPSAFVALYTLSHCPDGWEQA